MTTAPNFRDLCADLLWQIELYTGLNPAASEMSSCEKTERLMDAMAATRTALATPPPEPPTVMEDLAARPLLEHVARLGDRIGANTVGEIMAISSRAAAWLKANPPGQPVAIEPRGCPTPGACSCVEPATPPPEPLSPTAKAVSDAYENNLSSYFETGLIAAIRALADQVVPENWFGPPENVAATQREITRTTILAIATELEGQ